MTRKNTVAADSNRSRDWPEFLDRLAGAVDELAEDQYLILNVKQSNRYVQFAGQGAFGLRAETTSNHYLEKPERLGRKQIAALAAMGWQAPTGKPKKSTPRKDPDGSPNFFVEFEAPVSGQSVATMAINTLIEILGVSHPAMLEYEAFDRSGRVLDFAGLGLKFTERRPAGDSKSAGSLREMLLATLRSVTGLSDLEPDSDGDISARYGSMMAYARVFESPLMVNFYSPLLREVDVTPELLDRINQLNRGSREIRFYLVEDVVFATAEVRVVPYVEAHVADAYRFFCQVGDDLDDLLQGEFGGKRMFSEWQPSTVRH